MKKELLSELEFCTHLWETKGGCTFGGGTRCSECAAPYLALKLLTGEVIHGNVGRFTLENWKEKIHQIKQKFNS